MTNSNFEDIQPFIFAFSAFVDKSIEEKAI
jgi:hypothetical protein